MTSPGTTTTLAIGMREGEVAGTFMCMFQGLLDVVNPPVVTRVSCCNLRANVPFVGSRMKYMGVRSRCALGLVSLPGARLMFVGLELAFHSSEARGELISVCVWFQRV